MRGQNFCNISRHSFSSLKPRQKKLSNWATTF
jgi:hypothetical protein